MQRWLTQWILHLGAGFMPQTTVHGITSHAAHTAHTAHAAPRRARARRPVVVTARPTLAMAGRLSDGIDADRISPVRLRIDPADASRTRICGRMADVCDALDALIAREAARDAARLSSGSSTSA